MTTETVALCRSAISRAMVSICSGPMSLAGVLTMSLAKVQASAMAPISVTLTPSAAISEAFDRALADL